MIHRIQRGLAAAIAASFLLAPAAHAAGAGERNFSSEHEAVIEGASVAYRAEVQEFDIDDGEGREALSLFTTSYIRTDVKDGVDRPVMFIFNGGPSAAAFLLHMSLGPKQPGPEAQARFEDDAEDFAFIDNPYSLLDVADLVFFDPAETGFSRLTREDARAYFYSVDGDTQSLVQLIGLWREAYDREDSPLYILGESYGSIRQVVAGTKLREAGVRLDGQIIFGDSIFLMETSRRAHNIVSTAVSLPVLALTAAYHGKADKGGKDVWGFLDEVYRFSMDEYLPALARGYDLTDRQRGAMAKKLERYTGFPADYFLEHDLAVAKHVFYTDLFPEKVLDKNDTRIAKTPEKDASHSAPYAFEQAALASYMRGELGVEIEGRDYRVMAPDAFSLWDWGQGCSDYLAPAGLCNPDWGRRTPFVDYDWPEQLKAAFVDPAFKAMIVSGIYDGLSSVGTHRYLAAQLGFPKDRFAIHEYEAGHAAASDEKARPQIKKDIRAFLESAAAAQ